MPRCGWDVDGIRTNPDKLRAITELPVPRNVDDVRRFLGMVGYYRRFVEHFAHKAASLYELLKVSSQCRWTTIEQEAFDALRDALCREPIVLGSPDGARPFVLHTDASGVGLGAVLYQRDDQGDLRVVAYISRRLNVHESNYTATELECLAIVWAVTEQFHAYLFQHPFELATDHSALLQLFRTTTPKSNGRLQQWVMRLQHI